jgi:hypothetical protein
VTFKRGAYPEDVKVRIPGTRKHLLVGDSWAGTALAGGGRFRVYTGNRCGIYMNNVCVDLGWTGTTESDMTLDQAMEFANWIIEKIGNETTEVTA